MRRRVSTKSTGDGVNHVVTTHRVEGVDYLELASWVPPFFRAGIESIDLGKV